MINKHALIDEINKRKMLKERPVFCFEDFCFDKQRDFFRGEGQGLRFHTSVCSRRAGKTVGIGSDMLDLIKKHPGINILYITVTQQQARAIIWGDLLNIIDEYELDCKVDQQRMTITYFHGSKGSKNKTKRSTIYIAGAKDRSEIEKFRGWKLFRCYIDECQSFRSYIKELIDDIIIPALRDLRGHLYLTGTPGPVKAGVFYEYSTSSNWDNHHWTAFENPHMHNPPEKDLNVTLEEERIVRGIDENDPSYIRETYGKWVEDLDQLVFKFSANKNIYETLPKEGDWTYIMGVDIGYEDSDAIVILGYNSHVKKVFLVDEFTKNHK